MTRHFSFSLTTHKRCFLKKNNHVHKCCKHIIVAHFVLFTVLLDFSHLYVYKQLKKLQMSGHVKTSPGPQNTLRPQRVNGCLLSNVEGTANVHCYTSCTLTNLHCSKVSFLQCCHMKRYNKILAKMWGVYSFLWDTVYIYMYTHIIYLFNQNCMGTDTLQNIFVSYRFASGTFSVFEWSILYFKKYQSINH